ncbi:MAG: phosphate-starvation-inducible PsiE family protein [Prochlorothrix sp.]
MQTPWYRWLNSNVVIRVLETVQDLIVICLCVGLFSFMVLQLRDMFLSLLHPLDFQPVTSDILFLLILVELFRLLIIYLQEHRVSIGVAVEVSIVSVLREIIVRGVLETPWVHVVATCVFLLSLGALLVVRVWLPPTFEGIDPEQRTSERYRNRARSAQPPSPQPATLERVGLEHSAPAAPEPAKAAAAHYAPSSPPPIALD